MLTAESLEIMLVLTAESLESMPVVQERQPLLPQSIELDAGLEKQVESMISCATVDGADPDLVAAQNKACLEVLFSLNNVYCGCIFCSNYVSPFHWRRC